MSDKIMEDKRCVCEKEEWYKGRRLYDLNDWDHGYNFTEIKIKYCPTCGRMLPDEDELEEYDFRNDSNLQI